MRSPLRLKRAPLRRHWLIALVAALMVYGASGIAPVEAQSAPIIVPPIAVVVVGIPPGISSGVVGLLGLAACIAWQA